MRIKVIYLLVASLFVLMLAKLFYMQIICGRYYYDLSKSNRIRVISSQGARGRILDRSGQILADNRLSFDVVVTPQDIQGREQKLFQLLSEILGVSKSEIIKNYQQRKLNPFTPVVLAEDISREKLIILEENKFRFPSLTIAENFKRFYSFGEKTAHVLGYVGKMSHSKMEQLEGYGYAPDSFIGYGGVEEYYDKYLRAEEGGVQVEVNSRGEQVTILGLKEPKQGADLTLTIDYRIQNFAQELLGEKRGVIVLMDVQTGEILGLASSPSFNPNIFLDRRFKAERNYILNHPDYPLLNRALQAPFPPGSIFKVPVAICGLNTRAVSSSKTFFCKGFYELGGIKFRCTHEHGSQDLRDALVHSCNVYFFNLGLLVKEDKLNQYAQLLGLGQLTHIDLPFEEKGRIPSRRQRLLVGKKWYLGDTLNFSIGQGEMLVTPLQVALMMAITANGGLDLQPHVLLAIGNKEVAVPSFKRRMNIEKNIFDVIQKAMRETVTDPTGTAHILDMQDLFVAGKTGTAQSSGEKENHAWFAGYVFSGQRKMAFCIFLEHGGSSYNACLLAKQLLLGLKQEGIL